jgi:chorismate-pyruvate lyase
MHAIASAPRHPHPWIRECFHDPAATPAQRAHAHALLRLLIAQDGSATRLCEAIAGGPLELQVRQAVPAAVPPVVHAHLPGQVFIERYSCIGARGRVMMDNLVYVALDGLDAGLRAGLEGGTTPIGHLLEALWVRRAPLAADAAAPLYERLWGETGLPDPEAARAYTIRTPEGHLFLIAETFRRGMLMSSEVAAQPRALAGRRAPL